MDLSTTSEISERSLLQSAADDWLVQTPRSCNFTADVDSGGIECINDRGQTEAKVTRGGINRRKGLRVAGTRARNQVLNSESCCVCVARVCLSPIATEIGRSRS